MDDLAQHPHLRRIEVDTPRGVVSYPAPAVIFVDEPRHLRRGARDRRADRHRKISADKRHERKARSRSFAAMDRPQHGSLRHRHRATGEGLARDAVSGRSASRKQATPRPSPCTGAWRSRWFRCPSSAPMATRPAAASCRRCRCRGGCGRAASWNSSTRLRVGDEATRTSRIKDVSLKTGSTGTLCFVSVDHELTTRAASPSASGTISSIAMSRRRTPHPPSPQRRRRRQNTAKPIWPIPCCCFAIRR